MKKVKNKRLLAAVVAAAMAMTAIPVGLSAMAAEPEENAKNEIPILGNDRIDSAENGMEAGWIGGQEVLYPDGTLAIVSKDGSQFVASDVKEYTSVLPVFQKNNYAGKEAYGTHYLTLDGTGKLWDWGYNDKSGKSEKTSVAENVADFENSIALLENGDVVRTYEPNDVMLSDVKEISENEFVAFALKRDGTLWKYDYGECIGGMTADDHFIKIADDVTGFFDGCFIKDGAIYTFIPSTGKSLGLDEIIKIASFVPDKLWRDDDWWDCYAVKDHTLYSLRSAMDEEIIVTEDFQREILSENDMLTGYVDSKGTAHYLDGEEMNLSFAGDEIQKLSDNFILTTDGNLWLRNTVESLSDSNAKVEPRSILTNVADYNPVGLIGLYAVCTDGTLWMYSSNDDVLTQLDSEKPVAPVDPSEPSTDPATPSTDESTTAEDSETTSDDASNTNNPSTGDSVIALAAGILAAAAAGALLITRKKSGK